MEALKLRAPAPSPTARVAREVAGYLWRSLKPAEARALLDRELGPAARRDALRWATYAPAALLSPARAAREAWMRLRWGALAPREFRQARRVVDALLAG